MLLHSFFFRSSTDAHLSFVVDRQTLCWIIIRQCPSYSITLWVPPLMHNAFGKLYPLFLSTMLCFWACVIYSWNLWYRFLKCPDGWYLCFCHLSEPGNSYGSYSTGVTLDKISTPQLHRKREVNERLCIEEVGIDLELCVHAHGNDVDRHWSFLQNIYSFV